MKVLFYGWFFLMVLCLVGIPLSDIMREGYDNSPGVFHIRPWIFNYNTVVLISHLIVILAIFFGIKLVPLNNNDKPKSMVKYLSLTFFGLTALSIITMLFFPLIFGGGPWKNGDVIEMSIMRILVFLPSVTRTIAWGLLVIFFMKKGTLLGNINSHWFDFPLIGLLSFDLGLVIEKWISTKYTVVAQIHPYCLEPVFLIPWFIASFVFLYILYFGQKLSEE